VVELVVVLAPAPDHAVRRGDHHVAHELVARDAIAHRGTRPSDPGTQLEDVHGADHLTEDPDDTGGRVDLCRADLQQRRLAGAVGTEDHPALVLLDHPVDAVEQGCLATLHSDGRELEYGVHRDLRHGVGSSCFAVNLPGADTSSREHVASCASHGTT
jgi:hypothetical protein